MMDLKPRDSRSDGSDPDGVRVVAERGGAGRRVIYQALALFLAASCAGYILMPRPMPPPRPEEAARMRPPHAPQDISPPQASSSAGAAAPAAATAGSQASAPVLSTRPVTPRRMASHRASQDPPEAATEQPKPGEMAKEITGAEYIQRLHDAGIYEGIGAFNPPGTKPPLEGLAVPEDYKLPEGYVRHYQSTDDGQPIEPILMYSPDYEFLDANGNPIQIPENRVVPPELAPPGFPIRQIEIPPKREPGDTSR